MSKLSQQSVGMITNATIVFLLIIVAFAIAARAGKKAGKKLKWTKASKAVVGLAGAAFIALIVIFVMCFFNNANCKFCGTCDDESSGPAPESGPAPASGGGPASGGPGPAPASGAGPASDVAPGPVGPTVETGPFSSAEMYSTRLGPVTSLLGGTNIYAANGGQRTILTNAQQQYVYPLSDDGFGNGVTTGRYMSFSLFLAGVPDDVAGIVSAVYMVPIPPISTTGSTMGYADDVSTGLKSVNDKQCVAMGALYNDGQGIGYVTTDGYFANAGRTEIDLMETSKDSCQTTHHGFYGTYYNGMTEKGEQNLPSRLGNTQINARGEGGFVNYIRQETMPGSAYAPSLGNASTGVGYDFDGVDGCIDPNGVWNNPYTVSAINGIDYFNANWGYGVGKFIDTTSSKGVQYDYYIKPELATTGTPTTSNLTDYWSGVDDDDTATWYTLKIYYRIVQEQSDGTVNVLPNQDYYDALVAVDNSQVDSFIKTSEEAGDGLWFLVDSSPNEDFADAYGLPRAPCFYSGYDLKYMILTQSYWTPSLIGQAGAGPTIWLDGNEDPSLTNTENESKCKPTNTGASQCSTNGRDVACAICRGPNVSTVPGNTCTSIQQTESSNYYTAQQVQNVVACQSADDDPMDPLPGNMTIFDPPAPSIPITDENCCKDLNLDSGLSTSQASSASDGKSYYNIFFNLYMDVYLSEPHWTLDYQYRGVNTTKTAPALYKAESVNANAWRGGYAPQFGVCNIDSGWPSDSPSRGVSIVNLLSPPGGDASNTSLCPSFLTSIASNLNPTNQPQTLADLTDRYGKSQTNVIGGALNGGNGVPKWYQSVCFPEEGSPKLLWVTNDGNGQYAMKIGCNFLPTELQTVLP